MTSLTLTLSGNESRLTAEYFPPIDLIDGPYVCGLVDFQTFNSIPNVDEFNNKFHYSIEKKHKLSSSDIYKYEIINDRKILKSIESNDIDLYDLDKVISFNEKDNELIYYEEKIIEIPTGSYEIEDINTYLKNALGADSKFSLKVNNNTLKSVIYCKYHINFNHKNSIGSLLGFSQRVLKSSKVHESDKPINILKVNAIRIECNITTGAYMNNKPAHTIHEFFPMTSPGYKIVEVPKNVIYLPVTVRSIHVLNINIVDQDNNLINFRGETITIRIHIKKL